MSITTEEKKKYFAETALALSRAGFHVEEIPDNKLGVWLDEQPLCEVGEIGGITYRSDNISTPERMAAKDKAYQIVRNTAEYMRQMEQAPPPGQSFIDFRANNRVLARTTGLKSRAPTKF